MSLPDFMSLLDEPEDIEPELLPEPAAPDFMSVEDEPAPVPELVAGDEPDVLLLPVCGLAAGEDDDLSVLLEVEPDAPDDFVSVLELGLADGAFVSLPVLAGVFVSLLEPLPPVEVPVAPAPDEEPVAEPLAPLAPPLWANADVASIAPATVSAKALIHVFITILLLLLVLNVVRRRAQLAWRRSATFRTSCSAGGASTRASRGSVTGRPSRAER
jgi:hypothetical protein